MRLTRKNKCIKRDLGRSKKTIRRGRKTRKNHKKQFLYNPNDQSKSFDVYINKNPSDTIPIKYTTVKDVRETISKLEILYKNKKYPHKRIWQVAMIMKVRLEAMKKHKKTRYPNAKNVTSRYNLANEYFKKLGKRSKELAKKRRTRKKKGGSDGDTDDEEILKLCADKIKMIKDNIYIDSNELNRIQKMVDDNSSTIDDIIMKSIDNKKDAQENLWDLILKLKSFIEKDFQSGGDRSLSSTVPTVRTTSGEDPRGPHEIDPHDIPPGIRQVLHWEDLTEEDMKELQNIGANQEEVMDLMALGMTLEQLHQVVRNVDDSLSNRGIIRRGPHFNQTQGNVPRFPFDFRYILLAIMMLLISLPRVIDFLSVRDHTNSGLNLILDMLQLILSLLYLIYRT